ncbi:MAG: hypothetical protein KAS32_05795 [Candidatus Peribacteraceae bacterium]|nr:hypothetical protein [Candidatus Peribacteraceae bacterium]
MEKIVKLDKCCDKCQHHAWIFPGDAAGCKETEKEIIPNEMVDGFPTWCPLDNSSTELFDTFIEELKARTENLDTDTFVSVNEGMCNKTLSSALKEIIKKLEEINGR